MITLLTSFKPFRGDLARLQENALANWRHLDPSLEIIVYGRSDGLAEPLARYQARQVPDIASTASGVPDFSSIARHAAGCARHELQVYLNGDILLPPDFVDQVRTLPLPRFLLTGQRINLARGAAFDPLATDWLAALRGAQAAGALDVQGTTAQDYFVFPRGLWEGLPPLIVGRGSYDSALLAFCLRRHIPVIDATWSLPVVHQWHDYSHLDGTSEAKARADTLANKRQHDILHSNPDIEDATGRLLAGRIVPSKGSANPLRRLEILLRYRLGLKRASYACRAATRLAWLCGRLRPRSLSVDDMLGQLPTLPPRGAP